MPLSRRCFFFPAWLLLVGIIHPASAQTPLAPVYNPDNGHWYQAVPVPGGIAWPAARAAAASLSYAGYPGHLVTITSAAENQFLVSHLPLGLDNHWRVGGYQDQTAPDYSEPAGGWRWITGEPWSYTNWHAGEPNNFNGENLLEMHSDGTWNDTADQPPGGGYIVEFEPFPTPGVPGSSAVQLQLFPNSVVGAQAALGEVTLAQPAGVGGVQVSLASSNPAAAVPPAVVIVPPGLDTLTFPMVTFPVAQPTPVAVSATSSFGAATAVLVVLPGAPGFPAGNLLVNGSFELPNVPAGQPNLTLGGINDLPGWRLLRGTVDVVPGLPAGWPPAPDGGRQSLDLVGNPGAGTIEQGFPTYAGHTYLFSGWISHAWGISEGRANVFLNGQPFVQLYHSNSLSGRVTPTDLRWQRFSYLFQATGATTTLTISDVTGLSDVGGLVLDGLSVTPADGPNSPAAPPAVGPPLAPTGLAVTAVAANQVTLVWTDNSDNETAFAVWRKGGGADWARVGALAPNTTTFTDTGLTPGVAYTYRVRA